MEWRHERVNTVDIRTKGEGKRSDFCSIMTLYINMTIKMTRNFFPPVDTGYW